MKNEENKQQGIETEHPDIQGSDLSNGNVNTLTNMDASQEEFYGTEEPYYEDEQGQEQQYDAGNNGYDNYNQQDQFSVNPMVAMAAPAPAPPAPVAVAPVAVAPVAPVSPPAPRPVASTARMSTLPRGAPSPMGMGRGGPRGPPRGPLSPGMRSSGGPRGAPRGPPPAPANYDL